MATPMISPTILRCMKIDDSRCFKIMTLLLVSIPDVKTCVKDPGFNLNNGATITVTYTAHLNENAAVNGCGASRTKTEYVLTSTLITPDQTANTGARLHSRKRSLCVHLPAEQHQACTMTVKRVLRWRALASSLYSDADCKNEVKLYQDGEFYYPIKNATGKDRC